MERPSALPVRPSAVDTRRHAVRPPSCRPAHACMTAVASARQQARQDGLRQISAPGSTALDDDRSAKSLALAASLATKAMALLLLLSLLVQPSDAALVPFQNCLPDSYKDYKPSPLQWVPLYVDAVFDTQNPNHNLRVTVWGNVTGAYTKVDLPPWNSPDWSNPNMTDGKIVNEPKGNSDQPKLTTLYTKVDFLSYEPWNFGTSFCNGSLTNGSCPLGPVFNTSALDGPEGLPAVFMSKDFNASYAFTSLTPTFIIIYGDDGKTNIGCVSTTVTPDLGTLTWMLKFVPLIVLLFVGFATVFAQIFSPWGTTDIFHWSSNYGRDPDLLRLVTPGFGDCLQYIQFIALTGGLTLSFPGFYQPIASQAAWSALMFNQSFVSKTPGYQSLVDGIYVTSGTYGLQNLAQLVGMGNVEDIWGGMMIWLLVIIGAMVVLVQVAFLLQWVYRYANNIPEEDLRAKNVPFTLGNIIRILLNYFLLPIVALSTFQLVVTSQSPAWTVGLAVLTILFIMGIAGWLLYLITTTRPRAVLFDDLSTVLLYGPLYNTYSDEAAAFSLIPVLLTFVRGIAIGAVQPSGVAQLVLLAICEVIQILTLHAFRPFHSPTSMNAYHTLFSALRLAAVLLMITFVPALGITDGPKEWIGYVVLVIHAGVLILGFLLNGLQTIVEVVARMMGAGGDDERGQTRGGLSKIFGMRQLSRRMSRRDTGPSRASQLSSSAMLDSDEAAKSGYVMPGGRIRSESAGSVGVLLHHRRGRSSSGFDDLSLNQSSHAAGRVLDSGASNFTPTTPGEASMFSFLPSPGGAAAPGRHATTLASLESSDPYYRPPRIRRPTIDKTASSPGDKTRRPGSWMSGDASQRRLSQSGLGTGDTSDVEATATRSATPAPVGPPASAPVGASPLGAAPRTDYSTREVDFYYGVRGQRLNSDAPSRKLGTGPADPTGTMASAAGWFRTLLGGAGKKEKGKGFEVVRSARMPPAMKARGGQFDEETPPEGIPVAMGVLRSGPIESDEEDDATRRRSARVGHAKGATPDADLLNEDGTPQQEDFDEIDMPRISAVPPVLPDVDAGGSIRMPSRIQSKASRYTRKSEGDDEARGELGPAVPDIPRKSSRRRSMSPRKHMHSRSLSLVPPSEASTPSRPGSQINLAAAQGSPRLPFEGTPSRKRRSEGSTTEAATEGFSQVDLSSDTSVHDDAKATRRGFVQRGSVNTARAEQHHVAPDLMGASAEIVNDKR